MLSLRVAQPILPWLVKHRAASLHHTRAITLPLIDHFPLREGAAGRQLRRGGFYESSQILLDTATHSMQLSTHNPSDLRVISSGGSTPSSASWTGARSLDAG